MQPNTEPKQSPMGEIIRSKIIEEGNILKTPSDTQIQKIHALCVLNVTPQNVIGRIFIEPAWPFHFTKYACTHRLSAYTV